MAKIPANVRIRKAMLALERDALSVTRKANRRGFEYSFIMAGLEWHRAINRLEKRAKFAMAASAGSPRPTTR